MPRAESRGSLLLNCRLTAIVINYQNHSDEIFVHDELLVFGLYPVYVQQEFEADADAAGHLRG